MPAETLTAEKLRSRVEPLGVDLGSGTTAGYASFDVAFALGAIEIAFGEDRAVYDESAFPGVVHPAEAATIAVSGDGTIAALDADDEGAAAAAVDDAIEQLRSLLLIDDDARASREIPAETIPFTLDPPEVETIGGGSAE